MVHGPPEDDRQDGDVVSVSVSVPITLGRFLKVAGLVGTGGEAKQMISMGAVLVNGMVESRRGRKLVHGDTVEYEGAVAAVAAEAGPHADA